MNAAPLPTPGAVEHYGLHWLAVLLATAVLGGAPLWESLLESHSRLPPAPASMGEADWFFLVRLPEVPVGEEAAAAARTQVDRWLTAMKRTGFRPILLSQAARRLKEGKGLPENAVALVVEPGSRHTYQTLAPVLARHQWPAAWLTDAAALRRNDRRYVSARETREMARSGWWDVGLVDEDPTRMTLITRERGPLLMSGGGSALWTERDGKFALNAGNPRRLRRLNANLDWSPQELVDRLLSERPLTGKARLTLQRIQDMRWGTVDPTAKPGEAAFELKAPPDRRGAAVYWLGTRGIPDMRVDIKVKSLMGELWLLLRSDEKLGEAVRVAFGDQGVAVEEEAGGARDVVGGAAAPDLKQPSSFTASVKLAGDRVEVWVNGRPAAVAEGLSVGGSPDAVVRLMIYEKVTGAARAESVELTATPLSPVDAFTEDAEGIEP